MRNLMPVIKTLIEKAQNGVYTVKASGADIFGTSDQFHFVYKQLSGDGQIVARVASVQNTNARAKAADQDPNFSRLIRQGVPGME